MSEPNEHLTRAPLSTPLVPANRLVELDILRGLALFGVMAINLVFEFRVSIFEQFLPLNEIASPLDRAVEAFLDRAITLKAFALFSLLFGAGLAIQFERLPVKRRVVLLLRRLVVLLAIGLLHMTLIWNGDILTEYALAGLLALPFLFGPTWLLATSGLLFLGLYLTPYLSQLVPLPDTSSMAHHVLDARSVYATGSFSEVLSFRLGELRAIAPLHVWIFPRTIALFLLGAFIWRTGVVQRASDSRWILFGVALAAVMVTIGAGRELVQRRHLARAVRAAACPRGRSGRIRRASPGCNPGRSHAPWDAAGFASSSGLWNQIPANLRNAARNPDQNCWGGRPRSGGWPSPTISFNP